MGTVTPGGLVLTAAELAVLTITPPQDFHGSIPLTLVSIATEGSNADTAETSDTFSILVDAQADTPSLTAGSSTVNEDTSVNFGAAVTYASTDIDTSEAVSEVTIIGFPTGSLPTFTTAPGATVTPTATGFTVTGTEAGIRATVASFAVTAPSNSGDDFTLDVSVTVTDADGSTATTTGTHPIDVVPVADTPDV
ncbi:hemolysin-type calcium-binding region, partial [Ahrensia sp. R2A130]